MGRTIKLDDASAAMAETLVAEGRYGSVEDVVREAMEDFRRREAKRLLEEALARSEADVAAGRVSSIDEVFDRLLARYSVDAQRP
ncbi:ribbon-helix-helix domain-containing protein [Chthonobacter rhizosphaerae]|uniref:ribbon-helix-helix domain-containing protein n=1 Tax=Chthonobacter rhizosphaerae TaxID=2735553 RepID=UPI0015EF7047|nr:type II toxin-antitoxin system ParD family antitoxin [Chthonobacter rhizosphaerae]